MEVQGSAADLIELAMLTSAAAAERGTASRDAVQIQTSWCSNAAGGAGALAKLVREEMTTPREAKLHRGAPLKVDVSVGPNWLDVSEYRGTV